MTSLRSLLTAALFLAWSLPSSAADLAPPLLLTTNGVIRNYTNFFDANRDLMVAALGDDFGAGGGTNAWKIQVNGSDVASPTINSSSSVKAQAVGAAVSLTVQTNSIRTNELASAAISYLLNRSNQSGTMGWSFLTGTPTTLSGYGISDAQGADTDLAAMADLSSVGLIARTASGTAAARTITGDTEIVVANGNGVAGNPTLSIGAAIARVAAIASGYQPLANILTRLSGIGLGTSGDVLIRDANGWTNLAKSNDGKVLKLASGLPAWGDDNTGGGGGGNASTNQSQGWAPGTTNTFNGKMEVNGQLEVADIVINSATYGGIWGFANGGHGASNATEARVNLGVVHDQDVQAFRLGLLQFALAMAADGDMAYRNVSGVITNLTSTTAGRALLAAVNAAAQRTAMEVPNIAGDTMTGPLLVPYVPYSASWTNLTSNGVPTWRAVAEKLELLASGGTYFDSVDTSKFTNSAGELQFAPGATVGSGRVVLESAAGGTASLSGLSDVVVNTNALRRGDVLAWSGSNWVQSLAPMGIRAPDQWEEIWYNCQSSASGTGFTGSSIGSGGQAGNAGLTYGRRIGYHRLSATSTPGAWFAGAYLDIGGSSFIPTNEFFGRMEVLIPTTNTATHTLGFNDGLNSTNAPNDSINATVTNGVMRFSASMAGSFVTGSGTYVVATNEWHNITLSVTNQVASLRVTTNGVVAFEDSITSNRIPGGGTVSMGFGANAYGTGDGATNGQQLLMIKRVGMIYRVP